MATVAEAPPIEVPEALPVVASEPVAVADLPALEGPRTLRPSDHGRRMQFEDFIRCDYEDGCLYELARGVVVVTEIPGIPHGRVVNELSSEFSFYNRAHPGVMNYWGTGSNCRLRLPGMRCDRHPDFAIYLSPPPDTDPQPWMRWIPDLVVEVVSKGGEERDYVEKREEYLRAGVREYWILNRYTLILHALQRAGDVWQEVTVAADGLYRCPLLPCLEVRPGVLFGVVVE